MNLGDNPARLLALPALQFFGRRRSAGQISTTPLLIAVSRAKPVGAVTTRHVPQINLSLLRLDLRSAGAGIHVDLHTDWYFDNPRCGPFHFFVSWRGK